MNAFRYRRQSGSSDDNPLNKSGADNTMKSFHSHNNASSRASNSANGSSRQPKRRTTMDLVGIMKPDGAKETKKDLLENRKKHGECLSCGTQTHVIKKFSGQKKPLDVPGKVWRGHCLTCNPEMINEVLNELGVTRDHIHHDPSAVSTSENTSDYQRASSIRTGSKNKGLSKRTSYRELLDRTEIAMLEVNKQKLSSSSRRDSKGRASSDIRPRHSHSLAGGNDLLHNPNIVTVGLKSKAFEDHVQSLINEYAKSRDVRRSTVQHRRSKSNENVSSFSNNHISSNNNRIPSPIPEKKNEEVVVSSTAFASGQATAERRLQIRRRGNSDTTLNSTTKREIDTKGNACSSDHNDKYTHNAKDALVVRSRINPPKESLPPPYLPFPGEPNPLHKALASSKTWLPAIRCFQQMTGSEFCTQRDQNGKTPLHLALECKISQSGESELAPVSLIQGLISASPLTASFPDTNGNYPIHIALASRHSVVIVHRVLSCCPAAVKERNQWGNNALNIAISKKASLEVIKLLIEACPDTVQMKSKFGSTSLSDAIEAHLSPEIILTLLEACPQAAGWKNSSNQTALSLAIYHNATLPVLEAILKASPESTLIRDDKGAGPVATSWYMFNYKSQVNSEELKDRERERVNSNRRLFKTSIEKGQCDPKIMPWWKRIMSILSATHYGEPVPAEGDRTLENGETFSIVHAAAGHDCPSEILKFAIKMDPKQVSLPDSKGRLPLHIAAATPLYVRQSFEMHIPLRLHINRLVECDPNAARKLDHEGRLPLHVALEFGKTWEGGVKDLVQTETRALLVQHPKLGLYPFMMAALDHTNKSKIAIRRRISWSIRNQFRSKEWNDLSDKKKEEYYDEAEEFLRLEYLNTTFKLLRMNPDVLCRQIKKLVVDREFWSGKFEEQHRQIEEYVKQHQKPLDTKLNSKFIASDIPLIPQMGPRRAVSYEYNSKMISDDGVVNGRARPWATTASKGNSYGTTSYDPDSSGKSSLAADQLCLMCMEFPRETLVLPCRHLVLCKVCSRLPDVTHCISCSSRIADRLDVNLK